MKVKPYRLTKKDLHRIYTKGKGGRNGHLLKILPPPSFELDEKNPPGPHLAQLLHITKAAKKHSSIKKTHFTFELHAENSTSAFYLWVEDDLLAKKVRKFYTACYPNIEVVDIHDKFFINLNPDDLLCCARLKPSKRNYMPTETIPNGKFWEPIINALQPDEPAQKAVLQLLINPKPRSKMSRARASAWKMKQSKRSTEQYSALAAALDKKANEAPYEVAVRAACLGREHSMLIRKFDNLLTAFNRLDSDCGGNKYKRKIYRSQQVKFLNAMEDRNTKIFVGPVEEKFLMGTTELGHNFLSIPTAELHGFEALNVARPPIPEILFERKGEKRKGKIIHLLWDREMNEEELKAEHEEYLKRQEEYRKKEAEMEQKEKDWYRRIREEMAAKEDHRRDENSKNVMYR